MRGGEGVTTLVGQQMEISLDSSEIGVDAEETVLRNAVEDVVSSAFRLPHEVGAIVAVGGGVAIDYAKYAGLLTRLPVIAVPTAISNDGFASPAPAFSGRQAHQLQGDHPVRCRH